MICLLNFSRVKKLVAPKGDNEKTGKTVNCELDAALVEGNGLRDYDTADRTHL